MITKKNDAKNKQHSKMKYSAEYISYVEHGESAAVFITRDIVNSINTNGKWVDVIALDGDKKRINVEIDVHEINEYGQKFLLDHHKDDQNWIDRWDFKSFTVELFPRKTRPDYSNCITEEDFKYVTWETAHRDIRDQRDKGYVGPKFKIYPRLIVMHDGKFTSVECLWNEKTGSWVSSKEQTPECIFKRRKVFLPPEYTYHILKIERLNAKENADGKKSPEQGRGTRAVQSKRSVDVGEKGARRQGKQVGK